MLCGIHATKCCILYRTLNILLCCFQHILSREENWNNWKNESCPSYVREKPKEAVKMPQRYDTPHYATHMPACITPTDIHVHTRVPGALQETRFQCASG